MNSGALQHVEDIYPLSPLQQGMLFHTLYAPGSSVYVIQSGCALAGELSVPAFRETWRRILERHTVLRTFFVWEGLREPHQVVERAVDLPWVEDDWRGLLAEEQAERFDAFLAGERAAGFDLTRAPLMRLALIRTRDDEWLFAWTFHHLLMDGWSTPRLLDEAFALYGSLAQARSLRLKRPQPYRVYIDWLQRQDLASAEAFWRRSLAGCPGKTPFGIDLAAGPRDGGMRHAETVRTLPEPLATALQELGREHQLTLNTLALGAWAVLLQRYSGEPAVTLGAVVSGRPPELPGVESMVGPFINTLPMCVEPGPSALLLPWLRGLQEQQLELRRYEYTPLAQIQKWLGGTAGTPLFESIFVFENYPAQRERQAEDGAKLKIRPLLQSESTHYPLELAVEAARHLSLRVVYDRGRFAPVSILRLVGHFEALLQAMTISPTRRVGELSPLTEAERHQVLTEWNDTRREGREDLSAHDLFVAWAERTPDAVALVGAGESLTYGDLARRARGLAAFLVERGAAPDGLVAILAERSPAFWIAALASLAAESAYLPLDPRHPVARQARLLADSRAPLALVAHRFLPSLALALEEMPAGRRPLLLPLEEALAAGGDGRPVPRRPLSGLAYVIYTSGSTGVPKGVMVEGGGMLNHLRAKIEELGLTERDAVAQTASQCFDISVWQFLAPLLVGGAVHVLPDEVAHDPASLLECVDRDGITVLETVPSLLRYLLAEVARQRKDRPRLTALRWLIPTGEALPPELCRQWLTAYPEIPLLNAYGPTECSDDVTHHAMDRVPPPDATSVPIGHPLADMRLYVLDPGLQPVPAGVVGELHVAGPGVGRGYLGDPRRTAAVFVPDPFATAPGGRLYRTGDLARHRPDGCLEFAGRNDHQVKIRGHRIELGEIESCIARHPDVGAVVVDVREAPDGGGGGRLVAWVQPRPEQALSQVELRAFVAERLPEAMAPGSYVVLDALPLTSNGKVDRRSLPDPESVRPELAEAWLAPRTPEEETLAGVWTQVLGVDPVGVRDNFFALGGDSILSLRILSLARERGLDFSLQELFQHPTIEELLARRTPREGAAEVAPSQAPFALISPEDRRRLALDVEDAYPLARLQAGMLFHSERSSDTLVYHYVISLQLRVPFHAGTLDGLLQELARRNPVLRTSFELAGASEPLQRVHREVRIPFQVADLTGLSTARQRRELEAWMAGEKERRFDWSQAPLLRVHVHLLGNEDLQFTLVYHHSILDGWSEATLLAQLFRAYIARLRGEPGDLDEAPAVGFRDFVARERQALASEEARGFWLRQVEDATLTAVPRWPSGRRAERARELRETRVAIAAEVAEGLHRLGRATGAPIKSVLLAAHVRALAWLSGQTDVTTGLVLSCRPEVAGSERALGLFLNNAPLRLVLRGGSWQELVRAALAAELAALPHRWYPMAELQRLAGGMPLFETVFNFVHFHVYEALQSATDVQVLGGRFIEETDLPLVVTCGVDPFSGALDCTLKYDAREICGPQARFMTAAYQRVLSAMAEEPSVPYGRHALLTGAERQQILREWNDTRDDRPLPAANLHGLFEAQAARTPAGVAVAYEDLELTYAVLEERANQLARHLRSLGVAPGALVAVRMQRSAEMVEALLGILKAGGAYVPIETSLPPARVQWILASLGIRCVITQAPLLDDLLALASDLPELADVVSLDSDSAPAAALHAAGIPRVWRTADLRALPAAGLPPQAAADDLAYIIFTSGSTGTPKGVVVRHRPVLNLIRWVNETFAMGPEDRVLFITSLSFDLSVYDVFGLLAAGGSIRVASDRDLQDRERLLDLLCDDAVTYWDSAPAALLQLVPLFPRIAERAGKSRLRLVFLSGDWIPVALPDQVRGVFPGARVISLGGATEATVWSNFHPVGEVDSSWVSVPYGRPIQDARYHILDADLHPVPVGVPGDLHIGGRCLATMYAQEPSLTAQKFIPDPCSDEPGAVLYRTGDRARYWADGTMEFLGRLDHQVKVRGYRIELGEISAVLGRCPGVQQNVVLCREDAPGDKRLVAYVVAEDGHSLDTAELKAELRERLPEYMVPAAFVQLAALPVTANGKLDRRALPAPAEAGPGAADAAALPRNPIEELLASVWTSILGREQVGVFDDFFVLGGHSLSATQLIARVRQTLGIEVELRTLFEHPTIAGMAERIAAALRAEPGFALPPLGVVPREGDLPLSFAQQRLWFIAQMEPDSPAYNISIALRLSGSLEAGVLARSLTEIVRRHETLRTSFVSSEGRPHQVIAPPAPFLPPLVDLSGLEESAAGGEARRLVALEAGTPFDLTRAPLLRSPLIRMSEEEHIALFTMHHIVSDGWSMGVLVREVVALYTAFAAGRPSPLPALPVQYADFARWQRDWFTEDLLERELSYWRRQLANSPALLELPGDRPRPAVQTLRGETLSRFLPDPLGAGLRSLGRELGSTLFMSLLAAFKAVVHRSTGMRDVVVGSPIAGRTHPELEGLIGMFVNTLVLRTDVSGDPSFAELLRRVREVSLQAHGHQHLPFERLVEELEVARDMSRAPLFQLMFVLQNAPSAQLQLPGLRLSGLPMENQTAKFDLWLSAEEMGGRLRVLLEYSTDLFDGPTIERFLDHFEGVLQSAVAAPERRISELDLLSDAERFQLLVEWNDTAADMAVDTCLHRLIEAQVDRTPDATAVCFAGQSLSYRELDRRAERLARRLYAHGVGPESRVGICVERSLELVVGLLAIVKAGGAYVPLDLGNPRDRLSHLLADSRVGVLLTAHPLVDTLPLEALAAGAVVLLVDQDMTPEDGAAGAERLGLAIDPGNLAYVIYTSGSTGRPKGAMNTHRAIVNRLLWMQGAYELRADDVVLQKTPASFDVSVWEFFWPLLAGARLVVARPGGHQDGSYLTRLIAEEGVTTLHFVPSMLSVFLEERELGSCRSLRRVIASGEALSHELQSRYFDRVAAPLYNLYGPTEAAVDVTAWPCERGGRRALVPIGRPIANLRIHLLDEHLRQVPMGVPGELYIGGLGLARGYFDRPALTAERFVPDPFAASQAPGTRLYRTGDLARHLPDGTIDFLGRVDHQIKIRGFRIELGEIEAVLAGHPAVLEAAVVDRDDGPLGRRLIAYVVPDADRIGADQGEDPVRGQVAHWQSLYESLYDDSAVEDGDLDLRGWNSSYTGEPIPETEMREWVEQAVARIAALEPRRVFEIGCGSGLLLLRIAPRCERYVGTDFSAQALRQLGAHISASGRELPQVELSCRTADDFTGIPAGEFDLVILNSVVQYFPCGEYLLRVLEGAARVVRPGGAIFVGDVRHLDLLEAFHGSVQLFRASAALSTSEWRERVRRQTAEDKELLVTPAFWRAMPLAVPEIGQALIQVKGGRAANELTRFRYDVVLRVGEPARNASAVPCHDWRAGRLDLQAIACILESERPPAFVVTRIPNQRVVAEVEALRLAIAAEAPATVGEVRSALGQYVGSCVEPEDLWSLAGQHGYTVEVGWSETSVTELDAVFHLPHVSPWEVQASLAPAGAGPARIAERQVSRPLLGQAARRLAPELRRYLAERLPDYMVPSALVTLGALPLSVHGKLDRRALPAPAEERLDPPGQRENTRNPVEELLAGIFADVLALGRVGADEDFFTLGGHSLLATRVISRIRIAFQVELPLRHLFAAPTPAGLARCVEALRQRGGNQPPALVPAPRAAGMPLSFAQQRLWFFDQLEPGSASYNIYASVRIEGELSAPALAASFTEVVRRHEVLRTVFREIDGHPVQVLLPSGPAQLPLIDLTSLPVDLRDAEAEGIVGLEARSPFDLAHGPLLRARLARLGEEEHLLVFTLHHIVSDGWSQELLVQEISTLYAAAVSGRPSPLPELPVQYADFAAWQRRWLQGEVLAAEIAAWRDRLVGAPQLLTLPTDRPRPEVQRFAGASLPFTLPVGLVAALRDRSRRDGGTLFITLLAAFQILLARAAGQDDVSVGTPIAGRRHLELERLIGLFVNLLVLRTDLSGDPSFRDLLARVREVVLDAYEHQDVPFEKLVEEIAPERTLEHTPLFQVLFALQNVPMRAIQVDELRLTADTVDNETSKFDLTLVAHEVGERIGGVLEYDTDLFDTTTIRRLLDRFEALLQGIVAEPDRPLSGLLALAPGEQAAVVAAPAVQPQQPAVVCLPDPAAPLAEPMFPPVTDQVLSWGWRRPAQMAVRQAGRGITYGELCQAALGIAQELLARGLEPGGVVAIVGPRSCGLVAAMVGAVLAGGAMLGIEGRLPAARQRLMLRESRTRLLLHVGGPEEGEEAWLGELPPDAVVRIEPGSGAVLSALRSADAPEAPLPEPRPDDPAYVIFTSGTTGVPKAVLGCHKGLAHFIAWQRQTFAITAQDRGAQLTSLSFDPVLRDIFLPLTAGATLCLPDEDDFGADRVLPWLEREGITFLHTVPSLADSWLGDAPPGVTLAALRRVFFAGEPLADKVIGRWRAAFPACGELVNLYGPAETTLAKCFYRVPEEVAPGVQPVGMPLPETQVLILAPDRRLCGIGEAGEIVVRTPFRSLGYLNAPEETRRRFIVNPFRDDGSDLLYLSGDGGRYRPDGLIEILGRLDDQVKIRGIRVEPQEVAALLAQHPDVRQAAVVAREDAPGAKRLVAYVVPEPRRAPAVAGFQRYRLPDNLAVAHLNKNETDYLYKEIFDLQAYVRHGMSLRDGDCVFDVGANIGLFLTFANRVCHAPRVYSFEPNPTVHEVLKANASLYGGDCRLLDFGISSENREATFTFFPAFSMLSGLYADAQVEKETVRSYVVNQQLQGVEGAAEVAGEAEEILAERFQARQFTVQLKTLSAAMRELGVERIDYLKINVEKSELDVLLGIADEDWPRIRQIVMEVDLEENLAAITRLLEEKGCRFVVMQDSLLRETALCYVYALGPGSDRTLVREQREGDHRISLPPLPPPILEEGELREYLAERLPEAMVPADFVFLEELPLTPNGKLDRRALPEPGRQRSEQEPRSPVEEILAGLWTELLGRDGIGVHENFFTLGGHSLLAAQLASRVRRTFRVELPLRRLFAAPTVAGLAAYVETALRQGAELATPEVTRAPRQELLPLSFAQERLWHLSRTDPESWSRNLAQAHRLEGDLDVPALAASLSEIVRRHESLRTGFPDIGGTPVQRVAPPAPVQLPCVDLAGLEIREELCSAVLAAAIRRPVDLTNGPLVRPLLVRLGQREHVLLLVLHHLVFDGWSIGVLMGELTALYAAFVAGRPSPLPELPVQYADFAAWQRRCVVEGVWSPQLAYWRQQLAGDPAPLSLPTDRPRPELETFRSGMRSAVLPRDLYQRLRELGHRHGSTLFMTVLTGLGALLQRETGQDDVLVGAPVARRGRPELERLIGLFTNMLPLRTSFAGDASFLELLERVRLTALDAFTHQDLPFEKMLQELWPARYAEQAPLLRVVFNFQTPPAAEARPAPVSVRPQPVRLGVSRFDLNLRVIDTRRELAAAVDYRTELFDAARVDRMLADLGALLEAVAADPRAKLAALPRLRAAERSQVSTGPQTDAVLVSANLEAHITATPDGLAVIADGQSLTFSELGRRADRLAHRLREKGVGPEVPVGVLLLPAVDVVTALLGVLKAGGVCLPVAEQAAAEHLGVGLVLNPASIPADDGGLPHILELAAGENGGDDGARLSPSGHVGEILHLLLSAPPVLLAHGNGEGGLSVTSAPVGTPRLPHESQERISG